MEEKLEYLTSILSYGYTLKISYRELSRRIANNDYFIAIERQNYLSAFLFCSKESLLKSIYFDREVHEVNDYVQASWAAEVYLLIQEETHFTFETIFEYFPLEKVYEMFSMYHEMDIYNMYDEFMREYKSKSLLKLLMKSYKLTTNYVSEKTGISTSLLFALQQRRRNINKLEAYKCNGLANLLHVRIETLFNN